MAFLRKKNNAKTSINQAGGLSALATSVIVTDVSQLPNSGDFLVTIWNKATYPDPTDDVNREIVKVTNVSGNTLTIERGQEDTLAKTHLNGHAVEMLITAGTFEEIENAISTSSNIPVIGEDLTSQIDGITDTFILANNYVVNTTAVYLNGQRLTRGHDYIEDTDTTIVVNSPIITIGQKMIVDYYSS